MAISIVPIHAPELASLPAIPRGTPGTPGAFQSVFTDAVHQVEQFRSDAQQSVEKFLSGEGEEIHHVAMAAQQAELSFELFLQVRNKVISAYQEVMRMQL